MKAKLVILKEDRRVDLGKISVLPRKDDKIIDSDLTYYVDIIVFNYDLNEILIYAKRVEVLY